MRRAGWRLAGLLALLALGAGPAGAGAAGAQRVEVPSLDRRGDAALLQPGFWFRAPGSTPAPAMLLLHGCAGPYDRARQLSHRLQEYAALLNAEGVHVLVTDSLTPRGEHELCSQRIGKRRVTQVQRRRDALGALRWLAAQPGVDADRLGLLGWSNGGSTVLAATDAGHDEVAAAPVSAHFAVAFYPGCAAELMRGYRPGAALLLLLGAADDWTAPGPCQALAASAGPPVPEVEVYAGAYHGFDSAAPLRLRTDVPNGVNPGQGVHVGGDPAARAASRLRLLRFVREFSR